MTTNVTDTWFEFFRRLQICREVDGHCLMLYLYQ